MCTSSDNWDLGLRSCTLNGSDGGQYCGGGKGEMMSRQVEPGWPQRPAVGQNIWVLCASVCLSVNCNALKPGYSLSIYPHPTYQLIYIPFAFV